MHNNEYVFVKDYLVIELDNTVVNYKGKTAVLVEKGMLKSKVIVNGEELTVSNSVLKRKRA